MVLTVSAAFFITGVSVPSMAQTAGKTQTTPSGLQIMDIRLGTGAVPKTGSWVLLKFLDS